MDERAGLRAGLDLGVQGPWMHGSYSHDGGGQDEGKVELGFGALWAAGAVQEQLSIGSEASVLAAESQSRPEGPPSC